MCGIIFHLRAEHPLDPTQTHRLETLIQARGPDTFHTVHKRISLGNTSQTVHLTFSASVLALRGLDPIAQPLVDEETGCLFAWNGEAWKFRNQLITGNDTTEIFKALLVVVNGAEDYGSRSVAIEKTLSEVTGPFAFLFYDAISHKVFYGRDPMGRRSLVRSGTQDGDICVASVSDTSWMPVWEEVKTGGIHELDILHKDSAGKVLERFIPWLPSKETFFPHLNRCIDFPSDQRFPSPNIVDEFHASLSHSMRLRTTDTAPWLNSTNNRDQFAVLFSGGIDCTLLAFILDQVLPAGHNIDLLNVAFENPRVIAAASQHDNQKANNDERTAAQSFYEACPDRETGLSSYAELCKVCPDRSWRFIRVNVSYEETLSHKALVTSLMYTHNTEMDLSISLALFFASRGKGIIQNGSTTTSHITKAKILFSGLGADEIFGGYTRHAKAFSRAGLNGLLDELDLDFNRLPERNLGRDDRIISHWGREIRYPYLDEDFTKWALNLPVWEKCGYADDQQNNHTGLEPSKLLLRTFASKVGLTNASREKKRAIQFGSRTAKMEAGKTKGTDSIRSN